MGSGQSQDELRELVQRGVERMRARRESERVIADAVGQDAEAVAHRLIVFARIERVKLRWELCERFGFSLDHGEDGYACRLEEPAQRPKGPEETARWVDLFVHAAAFEEALLAMNQRRGRLRGPRPGTDGLQRLPGRDEGISRHLWGDCRGGL